MAEEHVLVNIPRGPPGPASEASTVVTALASDVGSAVGTAKDAFQRSITFLKDQPGSTVEGWAIHLVDPPKTARRKKKRIAVESVEGCVCVSMIQPGDHLKSINGKRIGPSYNAAMASEFMAECYEEDGVLSVAVGNKEGDDVLVQATIIKPRSDMTYEELGIEMWYWGRLCIKLIEFDSIFKHTVLKSGDHILSINDIPCDKLTEKKFKYIIDNLPLEVTIVVERGKQRWTGRFG